MFRELANINGYFFAFIDDHYDFHTEQDSVARLDRSSLNHQADYLLSMLPYLANKDLSMLQSNIDVVYFNIANLGTIMYPFSWVLPIFVLTSLAFVGLVVIGAKKRKLKLKHIAISAIPTLGSLIAALIIGTLGWDLLLNIFPQFNDIPQNFTYNGHWIIACLTILSLCITALLFVWTRRKFPLLRYIEYLVLPIFLWLLLNLFIATNLTGGGFFIIPVFAALMVFASLLFFDEFDANHKALTTVFFIPALIILCPLIPTFVIILGLPALVIATALTVLLSTLLLPSLMSLRGLKYLNISLALGVFVTGYGIAHHSGYSQHKKKPTGVNYLYDTRNQQAFVFSFNQNLDSFTEQFINDDYTEGTLLKDVYPIRYYGVPKYAQKSKSLDIHSAGYLAQRIDEESGLKKITITITPKRSINLLTLTSNTALTLHRTKINGELISDKEKRRGTGVVLTYVVTDSEPVSFEFSYSSEKIPEFRILETSYDLSERWPGFTPRSNSQMPRSFGTDEIIISQPIEF